MNKKYRHGQLKSIQRVECEVPKRGLFISYINKVLCIYSLCKAHICHGYHGLYPWRKICHLEKFQISVKNLNNLWSFIDIYAVFLLNLCGEKIVWRKSVWRKNDKNEVWHYAICMLLSTPPYYLLHGGVKNQIISLRLSSRSRHDDV